MLGPQEDHFTAAALRALAAAEFAVSRDADRMGIRLDGPQLAHDAAAGGEIVSDGVAPGALQVPPDGKPILLLADCQTVGGYPKIATVIRADLPRLAHLQQGDRLRFALVTRAQAHSALLEQRARLESWLARITRYQPAGDIDEVALYSANLISGVRYDNDSVKGDEE
jgi:allophanate hydrolase subunit 2